MRSYPSGQRIPEPGRPDRPGPAAPGYHGGGGSPPERPGLPRSCGPYHAVGIGCSELISAVEAELGRTVRLREADRQRERAILVSVTSRPRAEAEVSLQELHSLARSSGLRVVDTVLQQRKKVDAKLLMGRGKLGELVVQALQQGVGLLIFDQELNPSQIRSITD